MTSSALDRLHPIACRRLANQGLLRSSFDRPADVVARLGAVQAQEFPFARWALALRMKPGATDAAVQREVDEGRIIRTHVMRPTWHFVAAADIRWMLELSAPRVHKVMASYYTRQELDVATRTRAATIFEKALRGGRHLTRVELGARLERAGVQARGIRLALLTMYAELEGVICNGPMRDKQITYALLAERAPAAERLSREDALAELASRFFGSHGPATVRDFVWWSGLTTADAKRGLEMIGARHETIDDVTYWSLSSKEASRPPGSLVHLLPIYDEYLVSYRDRHAVPHGPGKLTSVSGGAVTFQHALVIDGQVAGTWRTGRRAASVAVEVIPLRRLSAAERRDISEAAARYAQFLGMPVSLALG